MKIIVLNGSPKGDISVTMQYINYLQKKFKEHELKIINISQRIAQIEKDNTAFQDIISEVNNSDGVIWAFPLYVCTVHSNYQRFIDLIFERNSEYAFKGKYAGVLATSVHFYDHTAINYNQIVYSPIEYISESTHNKIGTTNKKILLVTDSLKNNNLKNMIHKFRSDFSQDIELVTLEDIDIKGGFNYECAYR